MNKTTYTKNPENLTITAEQFIPAPPEKVWEAWTKVEILTQWWAPKPWKAVSESFVFRPGGKWKYYMAGPNGEQEWCSAVYESIQEGIGFTATDQFCDKDGNVNTTLPQTHWSVELKPEAEGTRIVDVLTFQSEEELEKLVKMGFQEGFSMALDQLEALLIQA